MRKIVAFVLVLISSFFFFQCGPNGAGQRDQQKKERQSEYVLDTTIIKQIPLTMDGDSGTIKYHLMVKDWNKPVEWTYEVLKQGKTIYSKLSNDKLIDSLFNDDNYYRSDKGGYSENKRSWYLNGITKIHCDTILPGDKRRSEFKDYSRKLLLSDYGENSEDQLKNWDSFWNHNPNKSILVFIFSDAPESDKPLLAYHWKLKRFVQIYTP